MLTDQIAAEQKSLTQSMCHWTRPEMHCVGSQWSPGSQSCSSSKTRSLMIITKAGNVCCDENVKTLRVDCGKKRRIQGFGSFVVLLDTHTQYCENR